MFSKSKKQKMENNNKYNFKSVAILRYSHGEFCIVTPGDYVICAVTGNKIDIEDLNLSDLIKVIKEPLIQKEIHNKSKKYYVNDD